jgi:esterase/lipase superfamily enzyme
VNFALRHPDLTAYCLSLSGSFDIRPFLDGHYDDNAYFNNPVDYLPNLNDPRFLDLIRRMGIVLGTGDRDGCRDRNLHLSHLLNAKGIPHFLDDRKWCGHDWNYWRDMFPHYVSLIHT